MNLAIFHYHLNRGGVTRVVENQLLALDAVLDPNRPWRAAILFGGRREGWNEGLAGRLRAIRLTLVELPGLDYDDQWPTAGPDQAAALHADVTTTLAGLDFAPDRTVLHVHNHSLGKNRALPEGVARLAQDGFGLLLQIHDFAEDFRPDNYRRLGDPPHETLYPQSPSVHYAALNHRDHGLLEAAGVAADRLHLLPNPVPPIDELPPRETARAKLERQFNVGPDAAYLLYPVRCIRRKNVGEALLLSSLAPPNTIVGLTLAPLNPVEAPIYEEWKHAASEMRLPCRFEVGAPGALSFAENLAAADATLTTSLAEGFGMVMLESWLTGSPLLGRDLPEVTADFIQYGVRLDWLRPALRVPVEWIGREILRQAMARAYRDVLARYGRSEPAGVEKAFDAKMPDGRVDFGDLVEPMQRQIIQRVWTDSAARRRVLDENPGLEETLAVRRADAADVVRHNAQAIDAHFSLEPSGRRLLRLLEQVAASPRTSSLDPLPYPERILDAFLDPMRFRLIRT
ncbi:MAG: hypothetical protein JW818_12500 [Pirellulales bacterium]|nr:hypothetical protein [Pirellulales bacterium]